MSNRFSKATLTAYLQGQIDEIQAKRRFDPRNGSAQVDGRPQQEQEDYGAWDALLRLADEFELSVDARGTEATRAA